ncbi:MAG: 2-oxoacid:acceptor oxidoreductase subunit alpha [Actinomycetota bacterium]|nr:MAG: 2-oxoacid:acceptor oxidoreductase subunit alpha [Actinomycetota bacterium]
MNQQIDQKGLDNPDPTKSKNGSHKLSNKVNDFAIRFATVNGTGSASANNLLLKAIFRMGVPVSGKNLFPSNIQGLPTWYEIRVNGSGFTSRATAFDLVVAMNTQTYETDIASVRPGGYLIYDSSWFIPTKLLRDDINFLGIPFSTLFAEEFSESRERILMRNIGYAGAVAAAIALDTNVLAELLDETYSSNERLRNSNHRALQLGYNYAMENFSCPLPIRLEHIDANKDKILIDGNTATALGCIYAGATVAAWYPITPATSVAENFTKLCSRYRRETITLEDGTTEVRNNYIVLQAEDELAALGMVVGASWAGARAFTSTSGPGISLMNEILGLAYYTEIPAVIIDVQRTGPSTGMPTRVQQADIMECAYASHGDTKHILLFPADPEECFRFTAKAFDLAEHFQTPVIVLSDLDIGMNDWVASKFDWDDNYNWDRGRVLSAEDLEAIPKFYRYSDEDADFVTPRTLPGISTKGAYFNRGSGHDRFGGYTESSDSYIQVVDRLVKKHQASAKYIPKPIVETRPGARFGVITLGSCEMAVKEAIYNLDQDGLPLDYMRVCGFPFPDEVKNFIDSHEMTVVVEQNRDAQLRSLLILETGSSPDQLRSVLSYGGFPISADLVVDGLLNQLKD